jgi:hypothetical protein
MSKTSTSLTLDIIFLLLIWQIIIVVRFLGDEHARVVTEDGVLIPNFGHYDWAEARPRVHFAHHQARGDSNDSK